MGMGAEFIAKQGAGQDAAQASEAPDAEMLAAYLEGRLEDSSRREVEKALKESQAAREAIAEVVLTARDTDYHRELVGAASGAMSAGVFGSSAGWRAAWARLLSGLSGLAAPRTLALAGAVAMCMLVVYPTYRYSSQWPERAYLRGVELANSGDYDGARDAMKPILDKLEAGSKYRLVAEARMVYIYVDEGREFESEKQYAEARNIYTEGSRRLPKNALLLTQSALAGVKLARSRDGQLRSLAAHSLIGVVEKHEHVPRVRNRQIGRAGMPQEYLPRRGEPQPVGRARDPKLGTMHRGIADRRRGWGLLRLPGEGGRCSRRQ